MNELRFFGLGEARIAILSLIAAGPTHGYKLMKDLATRLGPLYRSSAGTVYPVLKQLEAENLIGFRLEQGRRMYRLTRAGRKALKDEAGTIADIWSRAQAIENLGNPVGALYSAAMKASAWAAGDEDREIQFRATVRAATDQLNKLTRKK